MPAIVQTAQSATSSVSFATGTTAGNFVAACVSDIGPVSTPAITGVTLGGAADNFASLAGTTFTAAHIVVAIWGDPSCAGGQTAVSATETNGINATIVAYEISGIAASSPLDKFAVATGTSTSASSGATGTTTQNAEACLGIVSATSTVTITGPASPWVNTTEQVHSTNSSMTGEQITTATGAITYTAALSSSRNWAAAVVTLLPAAAGTPAPFRPPVRPAKGAPGAVTGRGRGSSGAPRTAPPVVTPAPFMPPVRPAKGVPGAVTGRGRGSSGAPRTAPPPPAPFTLPARPAKGTPAARRGRGRGRSSSGTPRTPAAKSLLISLASAAGIDDYGNAFPAGILAAAGVIEGPTLIGSDAFYYSGTGVPALGALIASVAQTAGTDSAGNAYVAGVTTYAGTAPHLFATSLAAGDVEFWTATSAAGPWTAYGNIEISLSVAGVLLLNFSSIAGAINTPQASGATTLPLALPAPSAYSVVYEGDQSDAINKIWQALIAAGILSS